MRDPGMVEVLLRDQLLAPAANHDSILFELEVGFEIVEALERRGYQPMLGLLDGAVAFGRFTKSEQVVTVWSQKAAIAASGGIIGNSGPYARILAAAGLRRSALRPDFIIESNDPRRILLVEVKLHENGDEGAREGVRNMLAYLADAQTVLEALPRPHGLVISWGTSAKPNPAQRVLVAHQDAIDEAIGAWTDF